jgi:hypothetical protein
VDLDANDDVEADLQGLEGTDDVPNLEGDSDIEELAVEEAKVAKVARDPAAPTRQEVEQHEATHLPYRSWCPVCIAGRRENAPRKSLSEEERSVPEVGMDYCFIRRAIETETATALVVKDRISRAIRAHVLGFKGTCLEEASTIAAGAISQFGHKGAISLKTDNEPALVDLRGRRSRNWRSVLW